MGLEIYISEDNQQNQQEDKCQETAIVARGMGNPQPMVTASHHLLVLPSSSSISPQLCFSVYARALLNCLSLC